MANVMVLAHDVAVTTMVRPGRGRGRNVGRAGPRYLVLLPAKFSDRPWISTCAGPSNALHRLCDPLAAHFVKALFNPLVLSQTR